MAKNKVAVIGFVAGFTFGGFCHYATPVTGPVATDWVMASLCAGVLAAIAAYCIACGFEQK